MGEVCGSIARSVRCRKYHGGCLVGALRIIYRTDIDPMYWRLRHDGCSFCRRHGVVGTSDPAGKLSVNIEDPLQGSVLSVRTSDRGFLDFVVNAAVFVAANHRHDPRKSAQSSMHAYLMASR